jgi:hypothetical protein
MKITLAILSLIFIIVFASCNTPRYAYSPTAHNVPVFTKQGDTKVASYYSNNGIYTSTDDNGNEYDRNVAQGFDIQGAAAVTNNIALQAAYYYRNENSNQNSNNGNFETNSVKYNRYLFEFGAGFFTPLDKKQHMLFQFYAGMGFGKSTIREKGTDFNLNLYSRFYDADLTKYYFEPSMTFRTPKEIFAATIATRWSIVKFRNINTDYTFSEKLNYNLDSLDRYAVAFFEPSFVGSFGFPKLPGVRLELQTGLSVLLDNSFFDYRPFNFSVGLVLDIPKIIRGSKNE